MLYSRGPAYRATAPSTGTADVSTAAVSTDAMGTAAAGVCAGLTASNPRFGLRTTSSRGSPALPQHLIRATMSSQAAPASLLGASLATLVLSMLVLDRGARRADALAKWD